MNNEAFADTFITTMTVLSLGMVAQGIRVLSGKPFLLRSSIYGAVVVLIFTGPIAVYVIDLWPLDGASIVTLVPLVLLIPVLVFIVRRSLGDVVLYNVTETMLREALVEALDEHHLLHAEGERPDFFTRMLAELYAQTRFSLALPDVNGFVQVTVHPLGSAILRFTRRRAIPDYRGLIARLELS